MDNKTIDRILIFAGISTLFILAYLTLKSLLMPILLAFIFGYVFRPLYESIYAKIKVKSLSAMMIIVGLIALILIPLAFLMPYLIKQTFNLFMNIQNLNIGNVIKDFLPSTLSPEILTTISLQFNNILSHLFSSLLSSFSSFLTNLPAVLLDLAIFLIIFYFILIDFDKIGRAISDFVPLSKETKTRFYLEFRNVTEGIVYGQVLVGILQGILMGLAMFILGIEGTILFTIIAIVAGILPMIGPTIIWVPLGIFLIATGSPVKALILAVWGLSVSGLTDGILKPYILSKRTLLPVSWGFISTIGGLYAFGLIGLLLGPLIVAYSIIVLQFYKQKRFSELFKE